MQYYVPFDQAPAPPFAGIPAIMGLLVRTTGDERASAAAVRRTMQAVASDAPYVGVRPFQDLLEPQIRPWRQGSALFGLFAALALTMAAAGVYAVLAYVVAQRTREFGIRRALGARAPRLVGSVVGEGLTMTLSGLALGGVVVAGLASWIEPLLFGVTPHDPAVLGGVAALLAAVACAAGAVPAWRATRVNPAAALRAE